MGIAKIESTVPRIISVYSAGDRPPALEPIDSLRRIISNTCGLQAALQGVIAGEISAVCRQMGMCRRRAELTNFRSGQGGIGINGK